MLLPWFEDSALSTLGHGQLAALAACFVWSGFVRSGLGFGGAALALPLMLLIIDEPIILLPMIGWHLLLFSTLTIASRIDNVEWRWLAKLLAMLALPFAAGLSGLLNLPGEVLAVIVYIVTFGYGLLYALDRVLISRNRAMDLFCVLLGGYVSGASLIGAPLIVALSTPRVAAHRLRDTLFVVWIVLVVFKLGTFAWTGVDLQLSLAALTLPLVACGHLLGLKLHAALLRGEQARFKRSIGAGLIAVSLTGLVSAL